MSKIITFDKATKAFILGTFDIAIDDEGFLVEKNNQSQPILADGEKVKVDDFAGIENGSIIVFKSDLPSLIEISDRIEK